MRTLSHNGNRCHVDVNVIKPVLRAYALGYLTATGPRLFGFLRTLRRPDVSTSDKLDMLYMILKTSTQPNKLPTAGAVIVGGATVLPRLILNVLQWVVSTLRGNKSLKLGEAFNARLSFACTFLSAWLAFELLNRDQAWVRKRAPSRSAADVDISSLESPRRLHPPPPSSHPQYAGKTVDLTLFVLCRAIDVAMITMWQSTRSSPWHPERWTPRMASFVRRMADPATFATSSAIIMWAWFYSPQRLPRAYNHWISEAAAVDDRLIKALRLARQGDFVYGQETGQGPLLESLCKDLNLPEDYGDPAKTIPIPCEVYHCGRAKSCEVHAGKRFLHGWKFAMELYLPLQLLTRIRSPTVKSFMASFKAAARSSSFLAAFIAIFYYSVCLARTRLGPKVFSYKTVTPQMWDSGLCVLAGCLACGWSILLEKPSRRQEIAFFVAPRAMATLLPRVYDKRYRLREQLVFATSVAVVLSTIKVGNEKRVRGVFGRILSRVLKE